MSGLLRKIQVLANVHALSKLIFFLVLLLPSKNNLFCQFSDVSGFAGIDHHFKSPFLMGGGACFFDANGDLLLDLYVTSGTTHDHLYLNRGNGSFEDASFSSGIYSLTAGRYTSGIVAGDLDNDGDQDLFVTTFDRSSNLILVNDGNANFVDYSGQGIENYSVQSSSAMLSDFDRDGMLDIFVGNYIEEAKVTVNELNGEINFEHICSPNLLYHNLGQMKFEEIGQNMGVDDRGCTLAIAGMDYNLNGKQEIYVVNDFGEWLFPNGVYQWQGMGFSDLGPELGLNQGMYGMGIASADINQDMRMDFYVTNIAENRFLVSNIEGKYSNSSKNAGLAASNTDSGKNSTSWGAIFLDFDLDGDQDLYVANGFVYAAPFLNTDIWDQDRFFINSNGQFEELGASLYVNFDDVHRGAIYGDFDMDGMLDMFVVSVEHDSLPNSRSKLLKNMTKKEDQNWIKFHLEGQESNRDAFGSSLILFANESVQVRQKLSGGSFASQSSPYLHFGVGQSDVIDSLKIIWPTGSESIYKTLPANEFILIREERTGFDIIGCMDPFDSKYNPGATANYFCQDFLSSSAVEEIADFRIFPNPVFQYLNVVASSLKTMPVDLELVHSSGHLVFRGKFDLRDNAKIDVASLLPGLYFLKIKLSDKQSKIMRFIKDINQQDMRLSSSIPSFSAI